MVWLVITAIAAITGIAFALVETRRDHDVREARRLRTQLAGRDRDLAAHSRLLADLQELAREHPGPLADAITAKVNAFHATRRELP